MKILLRILPFILPAIVVQKYWSMRRFITKTNITNYVIHCIFNFVAKSYQKLENNKKKKECLKKIIEASYLYNRASKLLMKKFFR